MNRKYKNSILIVLLAMSVGLGFWAGINNFHPAAERIIRKFGPIIVVLALLILVIHRRLKR